MPRADLASAMRRLPISQRITQIMLANAFVVVVLMALAWFGVELFTTQSQRLAELAGMSRRVEDMGSRCTGLALFLRQHLEDRSPQARAQAESMANALIEDMAALADAPAGAVYQFERLAYFTVDPDSQPGRPVFNRSVTLRDSWAQIEKAQKEGE